MATRTNNNRTYYINPAYLTFNENSGYGANLIQVSASSSCWISVYDKANGIGYSDADKNYQRWKVTAYNNKFPDKDYDAYRIYVRLERNGTSALIVYSKKVYNVDGSSADTEASADYYYIYIGDVSATDGTSIRDITYDTGYLESDQGYEDVNEINEMWELDKYNTPWLLKAKQWLHSFTVKGFISLIGGLVFKNGEEEKIITDIKRSTDDDESVPVSDETLPTAKYISNIIEDLDGKFLRKDQDDHTPHSLSVGKDISVGKKITTHDGLSTDDFLEGASGASVYQNKDGQWCIETDNVKARRKFSANEVEIQSTDHIGGQAILTAARMRIDYVLEGSEYYRCYFRKSDGEGNVIRNEWKPSDLAYCNTFNLERQSDGSIGNHYYWRKVVAVSSEANQDAESERTFGDETIRTADYHFVDLSKLEYAEGSNAPKSGDKVVQLGYSKDDDSGRQSAIVIAGAGTGSPYIQIFEGIHDFSLPSNPDQLKPGDNRLSGRLTIKEGSTGWENIEGLKGALDTQASNLELFANSVTKEFENIRNEMDGAIDTWFGDEVPTMDNYPANEWATDSDKDSHLGDLYYTSSGKAYRFQYTESDGYHWAVIEDSEVVKALELAQKALDTADRKRRVFVATPTPPYDKGDLWTGGKDTYLMVCVNPKLEGQAYAASDWDYADNAKKTKEELEALVASTKSNIDNAISQAKNEAETNAKNYTDEGKEALQASINALNETKANISNVYLKASEDDTISDVEARALEAAQAYAKAAIGLTDITVKAYADGIVSAEEQARIAEAQQNLAAAKKYAEEKADEAFSNAENLVNNLEGGKDNLLRNTGFFGDYTTASLLGEVVLTDTSEMYSPSLVHWVGNKATAIVLNGSESGKGVQILSGGSITQTLYYKVMAGESYVFSFRGKGTSITFSVGGYVKNLALGENLTLCYDKFIAAEDGDEFKVEVYGNCTLCELQLERGTIRSAWGMSPLDNRTTLAQYESLTYLKQAIEDGSTEFTGGLALANLMFAKDFENNITAGMSGVHNDEHSVAFFAGGDYEQAIATALAYASNPSYQASETEIQNMAKFVVTHGGRAILNDVVLRGYIYALGGKFKGEIEALSGTFQNIKSPNGRFEIDDSGNVQIGAFFSRTNSLTNQDSNGNYVGGANISSRAYDVSNGKDRIAEIGSDIVLGSNGVYCMGRFENGDNGGYYGTNYGIMVGAYNAGYNAAISMEGGYIQGFALKTIVLDSYTTTHTLNRKDAIVICNNSNELILTLPSMKIYDDGHTIKIKRMNANVVLKAEKCETMKSDGSSRGFENPVLVENPTTIRVLAERGFSFASTAGGYIDLVWSRESQYVVDGKTYYGAWIVINRDN